MEKIYLVACTQQKVSTDRPVEARELYMASQWFRKARALAEVASDRWFIVSAGLGLAHPYELVEPYDAYVGNLLHNVRYDADGWGPEGMYRDDWAETVLDELLSYGTEGAEVVLLGSKLYVETLRPLLEDAGFSVATPLKGLGIGDQKKTLAALAA